MQGEGNHDRPEADFERAKTDFATGLKQEQQAATQAFHDASDEISRKAGDYASEAKDALFQRAAGVQGELSSNLVAFSGALRAASEHLANADQRSVSKFVLDAAGGLERLSSSLKDKSLEEVLGEIRSFGRENAGALTAGSVLAGLALGRLLKSSPSSPTDTADENQFKGNSGSASGEPSPGGLGARGTDPSERDASSSDDPNDGWVDTSVETGR